MPNPNLPPKKTKIVCTIGPASQTQAMLERMMANGMNVARLNFAHGDFDRHAQVIKNIRAAAGAVEQRVAIMGDLPGPKMRIGRLAQELVELERGQSFILQTEDIIGTPQRVSLNFAGLPQAVKPGDKIFLSDGFIQLEVKKVKGQEVHCEVLVGGELRPHKGVNFPDIELGVNAFTPQDRKFLEFAAAQKLDAISQSFVEGPEDIELVRQTAAAMNYEPFIIAKIERSRAVENLAAILKVSDGIMVARGDLGVEIPIEKIAITQKQIIRQANLFERPVITATHMLESMVHNRRPTRAEATDVANAILDGTDCVMLSEETAVGSYPADAVAMMTHIAEVTEPQCCAGNVVQLLQSAKNSRKINTEDLISLSIFFSIETLDPCAIITPTLSGATPRRLSRFRVPMWIVAVSPNQAVCQNMQFSYGVYPVHETTRPANWEHYARRWLEQHGVTGDVALLTQGSSGGTNQLEIVDLNRPLDDVSIW
ncbi:MAG: pyruvate kinase [Anaerolineae bacterium]|nr:pyruvate kinase [Anaerolineae bacterium]